MSPFWRVVAKFISRAYAGRAVAGLLTIHDGGGTAARGGQREDGEDLIREEHNVFKYEETEAMLSLRCARFLRDGSRDLTCRLYRGGNNETFLEG